MASIKPVKDKVIWALKHLKSFEAETHRYFDQNPGEVVADDQSDPNGRILLKFNTRIPVPSEIPLTIGDVFQNLRSSLDYLVWELVEASGNKPTHQNMFPICDTVDEFERQVTKRHRLEGVPPDAVTEIKALQPYHYGAKFDRAPIRVIDHFSNINKHRRILLTVLGAHASRTQFIGALSGVSVQRTFGPRYHGAELAVSPIPVQEDHMEVEGHALLFITFDEGPAKGIEVSGCLAQLWHFIDKVVIPKFERFFV